MAHITFKQRTDSDTSDNDISIDSIDTDIIYLLIVMIGDSGKEFWSWTEDEKIKCKSKEEKDDISKKLKMLQTMNKSELHCDKRKGFDIAQQVTDKNNEVYAFYDIENEKIVLAARDYEKLIKAEYQVETLGEVDDEIESSKEEDFGYADSEKNYAHFFTNFSASRIGSYNGEKLFTAYGVLIKVYKDDIFCLNVDAIVNVDNEHLAHKGDLSFVIASAAGKELEKECQRFLKRNESLCVTQSMTTTAGRLHYKGVIHTVGPCWSDYQDKQQCADDLAKSICCCITEADYKGFCSLAIPPISLGVFGVPWDLCVAMYIEGVKMYLKRRSGGEPVQEIHFFDIDVDMINYIQGEFTKQPNFFQSVEAPIRPEYGQRHAQNTPSSTPKGKVKEEIAEGLQTKFGPHPRDSTAASVEDHAITCASCARIKKDVKATHWCQHCFEGLCDECSLYHTRPRQSAHHKVQLLKDVQHELQLLEELHVNTHCALHPDQILTIFCSNHCLFCCMVCTLTEHKTCKNLQAIDQTGGNYTTEIKENDFKAITDLNSKVTQMIEEESFILEKKEQKHKKQIMKVKRKIDALKAELDGKFQIIEEELLKNQEIIVKCHTDRKQSLLNVKKKLTDNLEILQSSHKLIPVQSVIARHSLVSATEALARECIGTLSKDIPEVKVNLTGIINIKDTELYTVSLENQKVDISEFSSHCTQLIDKLFMHLFNRSTAQIAGAKLPLFENDILFVKSIKRSKIKLDIDNCVHSDRRRYNFEMNDAHFIVQVPDNSIILSNFESCALIQYDGNLNCIKNLHVAEKPSSVCKSSDGDSVHVICNLNSVFTYSLREQWKEVNKFPVCKNANGIACHGNQIVIGHFECIVFHDENTGKEISRVPKPRLHNTNRRYPFPVSISHDGSLLFYSEGNDIVCRDMANLKKEVWRYSSKELQTPSAIDTDQDGNILIVGSESQNIHQVTPDGKRGRVLVKKLTSIKSPCDIFCNKINNTIYVTSGSNNKEQTEPTSPFKAENEPCVEIYQFQNIIS